MLFVKQKKRLGQVMCFSSSSFVWWVCVWWWVPFVVGGNGVLPFHFCLHSHCRGTFLLCHRLTVIAHLSAVLRSPGASGQLHISVKAWSRIAGLREGTIELRADAHAWLQVPANFHFFQRGALVAGGLVNYLNYDFLCAARGC